jgi:hypothetical protein
MAYEALTTKRAGVDDLGNLARASLTKRISGNNPDLWAKFREMDEATGRAGNTVRNQGYLQANQQAGIGQGLAQRNANISNQAVMGQVAKNKLDQAAMLEDDTKNAVTQSLAQSNTDTSNRQNALKMWLDNAGNIGDSTSAGAAQDLLLGEGGYDYTGAARGRMATTADKSAGDESWMRNNIDSNMSNAQSNADAAAEKRKKTLADRGLQFASGAMSANPVSALSAFL